MKRLCVIKSDDKGLNLRVSTQEGNEIWPTSVMIEQGYPDWIEDVILLESEEVCRQTIEAIRKTAKELGWEV
jgi:SepF-like predicted cell division protein (DUF552 family)